MVGQDAAPEIRDLELLNELLLTHARRARYAHRALLSFYTSTGLFMLMVVLIGLTGLGLRAVWRSEHFARVRAFRRARPATKPGSRRRYRSYSGRSRPSM
ncbi:MAG: hypothetical protein V3U63_04035 [Gemmatimonadota bacterium]